MFSDPLKLIPTLGYIAVFVLMFLGKANTREGIELLGAVGAVHGAISTVNNVNPKG